jgi:peroxiredoxin Q/BCP
VSPDAPPAQKKFHEKFSLPFALLCDTDKKVAQAYGVWKEKNMYGKIVMGIERSTFIVGPDGKVVQEFRRVKVDGHVEQVLAALAPL